MKPLVYPKAIRRSFTRQAENFEKNTLNFSNTDYLEHIVSALHPSSQETVLEVAAGTCICGRVLAPFVSHVYCLDMTPAMLDVGKHKAREQGLENLSFLLGDARALPFPQNSFDIVISRLAFHHFPESSRPFSEMVRVLKPGGKLALIDMQAPVESLRAVRDQLEALRDPSHMRILSDTELLSLFADHALAVTKYATTDMHNSLQEWLAFTNTPPEHQAYITQCFEAELSGMGQTGFFPYRMRQGIGFHQPWVMIIGIK